LVSGRFSVSLCLQAVSSPSRLLYSCAELSARPRRQAPPVVTAVPTVSSTQLATAPIGYQSNAALTAQPYAGVRRQFVPRLRQLVPIADIAREVWVAPSGSGVVIGLIAVVSPPLRL
jgi:hypothetical protein